MNNEKMTPRERLTAAFNHQEVDRIPVMPSLIRWIRGVHGCACELHQLKVCEEFGFDPMIMFGLYLNTPIASDYVYRPDNSYRDLPDVKIDMRVENYSDRTVHIRRFETPDGVLADRITWCRPNMGYGDGPNPHHDEPLVKSLADIPALKYLYAKPKKFFVDDLRLFKESIGNRGVVEFLEASNSGSWGMESLGPENMLMCAVSDKQLLQAVIRVAHDVHLDNLRTVLESGHKNIVTSWFQCGPSVGWSPENFKEFFLPLIREDVALVHRYDGIYRYQDDGKMADLIPVLAEIGVDIVSGLQPPPVGDCVFSEIKNKWGDKLCLMGALDPIYTFEFGTPESVHNAVRHLLEHVNNRYGIIIGTAEAFGPETPVACLHALSHAVRKL